MTSNSPSSCLYIPSAMPLISIYIWVLTVYQALSWRWICFISWFRGGCSLVIVCGRSGHGRQVSCRRQGRSEWGRGGFAWIKAAAVLGWAQRPWEGRVVGEREDIGWCYSLALSDLKKGHILLAVFSRIQIFPGHRLWKSLPRFGCTFGGSARGWYLLVFSRLTAPEPNPSM